MSNTLESQLQDIMDEDDVKRLQELLKENKEILEFSYSIPVDETWVNITMIINLMLNIINRYYHLWNIVLY
jgi:hypothetical protein